jgi:hypothetical protein
MTIKSLLRIEEKGVPLTHAECGGEIVSVEAAYTLYSVEADGYGGFDYSGWSELADPIEGWEYQFECRMCGKHDDHPNVVIEGTEVKFK